jgi:hypothetical protein
VQRYARYTLVALAWLFAAGIVVQVFLAGMGLFRAGPMQLHIDVGYLLHLGPILILLLIWPARAGRWVGWPAAALLVAVFIQPAFVYFRSDVPLVAALHPVNALLILCLSLLTARRAWASVAGRRER